MLNFCDFIQVFVFTRNHHLNAFNSVLSALHIVLTDKNITQIVKHIYNSKAMLSSIYATTVHCFHLLPIHFCINVTQ